MIGHPVNSRREAVRVAQMIARTRDRIVLQSVQWRALDKARRGK